MEKVYNLKATKRAFFNMYVELMTVQSPINKLRKQLNKTRFKKDKKVIEAQLKIERKIANGKFPKSFFDKYGK